MMLQRHYDEEALIAILHEGEEAVSSDAHLSACSECTHALDSYRVIAEVLGQQAVWDLADAREDEAALRGAAALRKFVTAADTEDRAAIAVVDDLLRSPRQWWAATVARDERYQTGAVVRRMIDVSEQKMDTMPPEAIDMASAAITLAEDLELSEPVLQLRGAAYRQHAYALFYTGDFAKALTSIERAQTCLERCIVSDYPLARLDIVRSLVLGAQHRYAEARDVARRAARTFRVFGDVQKLVSAQMSEAYLLMTMHNFREALTLLLDIEQNYSGAITTDTRARTLMNIAGCRQALGQIAEAIQTYQIAAALNDELGVTTEAARVRYNVAVLLAAQGKQDEARKRLLDVQAEFLSLGMTHIAVVAGLELAEIALLENNFKEVEDLCRAAIRQFESAGIAHSSEALTALTFLREAAEQRRATQETVWHVKTYLRRLPDEPALLFAPAPFPPS